jgi:hypothetical protein
MKRKTARRLFESLNLKRNPRDPKKIGWDEVLPAIIGDEAAASVLVAGKGSPLNLSGYSLRDLEGLPHVGPGRAGRLFALMRAIELGHSEITQPVI